MPHTGQRFGFGAFGMSALENMGSTFQAGMEATIIDSAFACALR
jgi:hypothetical protein